MDTPEFINQIERAVIPFEMSSDPKIMAINSVFNYRQELKTKWGMQHTMKLLPQRIVNKLYSFQKQGIFFGQQKFGRLLIGDEMGVGKTLQAICVSYLYRQDWPLLIVCPSSVKYIWRDEIIKWFCQEIMM